MGVEQPAKRIEPGALTALLRDIVRAPREECGARAAIAPGEVVGRYEVVREIGRGGFGVVYEARDPALGRAVALKAVHLDAERAVLEERLLHEAEAAAQLSHPNVVTLHDVGRCARGPYLVMELLHGCTLAKRLRRGRLPVAEALRVALEMAQAVAHAHAHGVVHRDLTTANVFLCDDGRVKVLDFGLAQAFGRRKLDGGTLPFMAPEQRRGDPEDERTDVFALGVVLHRMLVGALPSTQRGPAPQRSLAAAAPPVLAELVARMLREDAAERPRDAGEVLAALSRLREELDRPARPRGAARAATTRSARAVLAGCAVAAALAAAVAAAAWARRPAAAPPGAVPPSVAVLPFADMSQARDQEYFSDGLAEEILNALAHVEGLRVAGRTSSFAFKGKGQDLRAIGAKLGVAAVLEGSVRKSDRRVRVTAQLVNVRDGYHLWSDTYDREVTDVLAVQDDVAGAVAAALQVKLLPGAPPFPSSRQRPANAEAYEQVLLARQQFALLTPEGFRGAVAAAEKAVALDPAYAPAWCALAKATSNAYGWETDPASAAALERRGLEAAEKAIALDPSLAEAYTARSTYRVARWDWRGARDDVERTLALAPGDTGAQRNLAVLLSTFGRNEEAVAILRRVVELDPLFAVNWHTLGGQYLATGQLDLARNAFRRALEIAPRMATAHFLLAMSFLLEGKPAAALAELEREAVEPLRLMGTAMARHDLGDVEGSRRALEALLAMTGDGAPVIHAIVLAWRGDVDAALRSLERARDARDPDFADIKAKDFMLPKLRGDPRYAAVVASLRLPEDGVGRAAGGHVTAGREP